MELPVGCAPRGLTVVDGDVFALQEGEGILVMISPFKKKKV